MALRDENPGVGKKTRAPLPDDLSEAAAPAVNQEVSPADLSRSEWKSALKSSLQHAKADRVNMIAGSLAYQWFLSLFPTLIALLGVTSLLQLSSSTVNKLVHGASTALPAGASTVISQALVHAHSRASGAVGATVIAGLVALYAATSGMTMLQVGLDAAYDIPKDRKFLSQRLVALELMVALGILGGAASALIVFGAQIGAGIAGHVGVAGSTFTAVWTAARWLAAIALIVFLFAIIYWIGPNRETPKWRWFSAGSIVAAALWTLSSLALSFYTSKFGSYGRTYGAFAGVAILILWLYVTGLVMLIGAEINAELERRRLARPAPSLGPRESTGYG